MVTKLQTKKKVSKRHQGWLYIGMGNQLKSHNMTQFEQSMCGSSVVTHRICLSRKTMRSVQSTLSYYAG